MTKRDLEVILTQRCLMFSRFSLSLFAALAGIVSALSLSAQTEAPKDLDLFLLVGQSNMAGRGNVAETDKAPDLKVFVLNAANEWANQGEPIHFDRSAAGVGLGFRFGKLAAEKSGSPVGLIPCAVGGTDILEWTPGSKLYKNAVRRARIAQKSGTLKGILWHQGESSRANPETMKNYADTLTKIVESFRADLNAPAVPFVCGELGEFLDKQDGKPQLAAEFNQQLQSIPGLIPRSAVVSSVGLKDRGDHLHFDSPSLKEFGARYFTAYEGILKKAP